jgi:hypothetical protein
VRVTRSELEALMETPLAGVLSEMDDLLLRNRIPWATCRPWSPWAAAPESR